MRRVLSILLVVTVVAVVIMVVARGKPGASPGDGVADQGTGEANPATPEGAAPAAPSREPFVPENLPKGTRAVPGRKPDHRFTRLDDGRSIANEGYQAAKELHGGELSPEDDLERVDMVINLYKWAYKSVPEGGENYEIMAGLTGDNPHRIVFFPPDHEALDPDGTLRDRWGTPYFFHKLSSQLIDITSAGPDRRMRTTDDFTLGHTAVYEESIEGE